MKLQLPQRFRIGRDVHAHELLRLNIKAFNALLGLYTIVPGRTLYE
jgi:hypothetical protein